MAFNNIPPNGFPALPDVEDLEAVEKDVTSLKSSVLGLTQDVTDLNAQKANQITIAPFFNSETSYDAGDLVYYNGLSYRCTNAHEGEWDADDFVGTTIANELDTLKSGLTSVATAEITVNEGVTIISQGLRKSVNTVTLICVLQKVMTLDTANLLCILPSGYRPPHTFEFVAINSTKGLPIVAEVSSTSGGVYVRPTSASADAAAQNINVFLTYVV